jgi:hypothetical protein
MLPMHCRKDSSWKHISECIGKRRTLFRRKRICSKYYRFVEPGFQRNSICSKYYRYRGTKTPANNIYKCRSTCIMKGKYKFVKLRFPVKFPTKKTNRGTLPHARIHRSSRQWTRTSLAGAELVGIFWLYCAPRRAQETLWPRKPIINDYVEFRESRRSRTC